MNLANADIAIIFLYLALTLFAGFWIARRASTNLESYFLGNKKIPWYYLGLSNASGMFDISGTMWLVTLFFVYGVKSIWLPWLWPVWNQVIMMVFLSAWLRRSEALTGAEWITFRFGDARGGRLSHLIVTVFAIVSVLGFMAYFFVGIGKFAAIFLPWNLSFGIINSEQMYALIIMLITAVYTIKGGMYSVVFTEVLQFVIMTISCLVVGWIAFANVAPEQLGAVTPAGWKDLFGSGTLGADWSSYLSGVNQKISEDGFGLFLPLLGMMVFKGIFASLAGPVPSYDMQRVLAARNPAEAAKVSGLTMLVLYFPRYLMIAGFAVLGLAYLSPELAAQGTNIDFETILPLAVDRFVPPVFRGLLIAGLLAAFMGTYAATLNATPAYLVNDFYKKYIRPDAPERTYIRFSYLASLLLVVLGILAGFFADSINTLTLWITSALYGGYAAANALKWIWWRFNSYGYFGGMLAGLLAATFVPRIWPEASAIYLFPVILLVSFVGCLAGTLLAPPDDEAVLKNFYKKTRPWGFWKPIRLKVQAEDPDFQANRDLGRDSFNVLTGIIWQSSLTVLPVWLILHDFANAGITVLVLLLTTWLLKRYWYDRL